MAEEYGVTVIRQPMDAPVFVNKLLAERQAGREAGSIDLLWVNGENFKSLRRAEALFGPFAARLPNFATLVDQNLASTDFGFPVEGFEAPFGQAQFVYEYDAAKTEPPKDFPGLLAWAREHPGRFTYPQPPDFTGSAFIRQAFYALTGGHEQYMAGYDPELFEARAPALWAYLNELKPYLWQEGRAYPRGSAEQDTLFARGEVDLGMSYHPLHAQSKILEGTYPATARTFVLEEGAIFNLHFTAIPFNAPDKPGAMVLANFLLSPEAQLCKLSPEWWGDFPALDPAKMDEATRAAFAAVDLGAATLPADALARAAVPEIPAEYLEALERGWEEHVLHAD
jgi:putative spermidine/putrescine transport system substrate-binding protein